MKIQVIVLGALIVSCAPEVETRSGKTNLSSTKALDASATTSDDLDGCNEENLYLDHDGCDKELATKSDKKEISASPKAKEKEEVKVDDKKDEEKPEEKVVEKPAEKKDPPKQEPPKDPNIVEFKIVAGTGNGAWNQKAQMISVKMGQTLKIINNDTVPHRLHTGGAPCGHQPANTPPGGTFECKVTQAVDPSNQTQPPTYDHNIGRAAMFWVKASP